MIRTLLKECSPESRSLCSVDPLTMGVTALAGLAGGMLSGGGGGGSSPAPAAAATTPAAPPPQGAPQRQPQQKPQNQSTFVGGVPTPPPSTGRSTLLGQ